MTARGTSGKGRGAALNPGGRFDALAREREPVPEESPLQTTVTMHRSKSIITRNDSPDIPFTQSINPYYGCEHGCVYCYARPSHAYLGLSSGLDFETRLFVKGNACELLRRELSLPGYRCEAIALGANTDPYQPIEREHRVTRSVLEVLRDFRHPVSIVTKSSLIERDLDILGELAKKNLIRVFISVGTLDGEIARRLEPRAVAPYRRIETLRHLAQAGVPCSVIVAPIIPFLNDKDLESVVGAAAQAGAASAGYTLVRLPYEVKLLFKDWLKRHYPLKAAHVMARIRDMRGGRENDPHFGSRMKGEGEFAALIARRFELACRKFGIGKAHPEPLDTSQFRAPDSRQLGLFEAGA